MNRIVLAFLASVLLGGTSCLNLGCTHPTTEYVDLMEQRSEERLDAGFGSVLEGQAAIAEVVAPEKVDELAMLRTDYLALSQGLAAQARERAEWEANIFNQIRDGFAKAPDIAAKEVGGLLGLGNAEGPLGIATGLLGMLGFGMKKKADETAATTVALANAARINAPPPDSPVVPG